MKQVYGRHEEIYKLADESTACTAEISDIIVQLTGQVSHMADRISLNVAYIEDNSARITSACDTFRDIYKIVDTTDHMLKGIVQNIARVDEVASHITQLSQKQSASTEEILASTKFLTESALLLLQIVVRLNKALRRQQKLPSLCRST